MSADVKKGGSPKTPVIDWDGIPKQTRTSIIVTVCAVVLCVAVLLLLVKPAMARKAGTAALLKTTEGEFETLYRNIASLSALRAATEMQEERLASLNANGVLVPLANSLDMRAMLLVEPIARECGVLLEGGSVKSHLAMPINAAEPPHGLVYARQPIEISGSGSYTSIVKLVSMIEERLPMATLSSLRILARNDTPEEHAVTICIEWPVAVERKVAKEGGKGK